MAEMFLTTAPQGRGLEIKMNFVIIMNDDEETETREYNTFKEARKEFSFMTCRIRGNKKSETKLLHGDVVVIHEIVNSNGVSEYPVVNSDYGIIDDGVTRI